MSCYCRPNLNLSRGNTENVFIRVVDDSSNLIDITENYSFTATVKEFATGDVLKTFDNNSGLSALVLATEPLTTDSNLQLQLNVSDISEGFNSLVLDVYINNDLNATQIAHLSYIIKIKY